MFKQHFFADVVFGLLDMVLLSTRLSSSTTGGVEMLLNFSIVVVDDPDETSATFAIITSGLSEVDIVAAVPLPEDPYEAIKQAYLVGTDTESEPFEDLGTESPESPHAVASPISLPDSTPPVGHVEESEGSDTSGAGSMSSDSTTPLSPDHPLTRDTLVLVPSLRRTARMAVRVQPAMSPGCSARIAEVAAKSYVAFHKRFRSPYKSSPSPSPTLLFQKRYRGTSELILSTDSEADELGDEEDEEDSLDSDSRSKDAEDEGPAAGDEDPGMGDESFSLGDDEAVTEGQQRATPVVETIMGEPLGLDSEDGIVYIDIPTYPPPAPPVQTPPSPEWTSGSLPISLSHSNVPSPISSPLISLTVPSPVATLKTTISVDEDQFIEVEIDRDVRELYTRSGVVRDEIFSQRPVLAFEAWVGHVDTRMTSMSQAGYDDHRLVHDLLVKQAALQRELQEMSGRVTALEQERDRLACDDTGISSVSLACIRADRFYRFVRNTDGKAYEECLDPFEQSKIEVLVEQD
ncbi:hypothetical protein Tco_0449888 [Tanacetum coccineum]